VRIVKELVKIWPNEVYDSQEHPFRVSLVAKNYVHDFGNLSCLVRGTVNIEDWDIT